jgi:hypothetical protein
MEIVEYRFLMPGTPFFDLMAVCTSGIILNPYFFNARPAMSFLNCMPSK